MGERCEIAGGSDRRCATCVDIHPSTALDFHHTITDAPPPSLAGGGLQGGVGDGDDVARLQLPEGAHPQQVAVGGGGLDAVGVGNGEGGGALGPLNPPTYCASLYDTCLPDDGVGLAGVAERVRAGEDALRLVEGVVGAAHVLAGGEGELFCMCVFVGCWSVRLFLT